jgi:hypothetical protein
MVVKMTERIFVVLNQTGYGFSIQKEDALRARIEFAKKVQRSWLARVQRDASRRVRSRRR